MRALGIIILPLNPLHGAGMKDGNETLCMEYEGKKFIKCMETNAYSVDEVFATTKSVKSRQIYTNKLLNIIQSLEIPPGVITQKLSTTLTLTFNSSLFYYIYFTDPKMQIAFENPDNVPRILLSLKENQSYAVYLKV